MQKLECGDVELRTHNGGVDRKGSIREPESLSRPQHLRYTLAVSTPESTIWACLLIWSLCTPASRVYVRRNEFRIFTPKGDYAIYQ